MKSANYKSLAQNILEYIGGVSNVNALTHCITRLRFKVQDGTKVNMEALNQLDGVISTVYQSGQYMVIIGTHVTDVYDAVCEVGGLSDKPSASTQKPQKKRETPFSAFISIVTDVFSPFFGVLAACGILKGMLPLLAAVGIMNSDSSTYHILYSLADGFFYYMPILLGFTAAKKFGLPEIEGLAIGAGMLYPNLLSGSAIVHDSLFGIPVMMPPSGDYTNSVLPIICAIAFAAWFEKIHKKYIPEVIKPFAAPLITCTVTFVLTILVIGPVTAGLTNVLSIFFNWLAGINGLLYSAILGIAWQFILLSGLHWAILPIIMTNLSTTGFDITLASTFGCNFAQIGAVLAIWVKTKQMKTKSQCIPAIIPASVGVIEPALFGVTLPRKMVFFITCFVSGLVGVGMNLCGVRAYRLSGFGIFGYASYANTAANDITGTKWAVAWSLIGLVISFLLVFFLYQEKDKELSY